MSERDTLFVILPGFPASCPTCGKTEGTYDICRSRWGYCTTHKTKWIAGYDMSAADEVTDEQRRRYDELQNEIGLSEFKYIGPDAEQYERYKLAT